MQNIRERKKFDFNDVATELDINMTHFNALVKNAVNTKRAT